MIIAELTSSLDVNYKETHSITKHNNLDDAFSHCLRALGIDSSTVEWKPIEEDEDCHYYYTFNTIRVIVYK